MSKQVTPVFAPGSDSVKNTIPRVSVVMSVYNEATRVSRAIDSLLCQTCTDFELILIDDGSLDQTPEILEKYRQRDARVRVIRQDNAGLTMALIRGCAEARGEYIARHDADDWSEPTRFAEQVALLDADPNVGFVSCATQYVGPNDEPLELVVRQDGPSEATRKLLDEQQGPPAHGSVMFRRSLYEAVGGYRSEFYCGQDSDLWMRMAEQSQIAYGTQQLYSARRDPFSLSGRMGDTQQQFGRLGQECRAARREGRSELPILEVARQLADQQRTRNRTGGSSRGPATMAYLIGTALSQRGDPQAKTYYWQAIQSNPLYWRAWLRLLVPRKFQSRPDSGSEYKLPASSNPVDSRFALLDVLRGLAVLAVIALHSGVHAVGRGGPFFDGLVWPILRHGYLGVQLFFVISGYCIMAAAVSVQSDKTPLRTFIRRRVRRIFPPFWCSLGLVIGLGLLTVIVAKKTWWSIFPLTPLDWLWNILLLQGASNAPDASLVYWSLSIEVQFYGLMAIAVFADRWKAVWLLGLSGLYLWWAWQPWFPIGGTPLAYWPEFASGIAAYLAVNWRVWGKSLPTALWGLSAAAILVGWQTNPEVFAADGEFATPYKQLFCLLCGLGIWGIHCFKGTGRQFVWLRPLAWIGTISYSLYLTHEPVATRVFNLAGRLFDLGGLRWVPVAILASVAQLLVGWLFFRYCERPWLNRSSRTAKRSVDMADLTTPAVTKVLVG